VIGHDFDYLFENFDFNTFMIDIKILIHYFTFVDINYFGEQMTSSNFEGLTIVIIVNNFTKTGDFNRLKVN
jgi:hypothetical protein